MFKGIAGVSINYTIVFNLNTSWHVQQLILVLEEIKGGARIMVIAQTWFKFQQYFSIHISWFKEKKCTCGTRNGRLYSYYQQWWYTKVSSCIEWDSNSMSRTASGYNRVLTTLCLPSLVKRSRWRSLLLKNSTSINIKYHILQLDTVCWV